MWLGTCVTGTAVLKAGFTERALVVLPTSPALQDFCAHRRDPRAWKHRVITGGNNALIYYCLTAEHTDRTHRK